MSNSHIPAYWRSLTYSGFFVAAGFGLYLGGLPTGLLDAEAVESAKQFLSIDPAAFWMAFASLFAIMNPLVAIPLFVALGRRHGPVRRRALARTAAIAVFAVLAVAAIIGQELLAFFAISIGAFRLAGGVVLLLMGMALIRSDAAGSDDTPEGQANDSMAICPIALPLLAGPGAIATIIVNVEAASGPAELGTVVAAILAMVGVTYATLRLAAPIAELVGKMGLTVTSRIMGMIVAAIAMDMMIIGLRLSFPAFAGG